MWRFRHGAQRKCEFRARARAQKFHQIWREDFAGGGLAPAPTVTKLRAAWLRSANKLTVWPRYISLLAHLFPDLCLDEYNTL